MKRIAIGCLAVAIAALALSLWFSSRAVAILGPSALAVMEDGTVWLSVDEGLWQLAPDGRLLSRTEGTTLGLAGPVGNLARHPSGKLVLGIRDQDALHFFDPQERKMVETLHPKWPPTLARHASRAISFAFGTDGRLAVATGGGHVVALFDASGAYLRQSPPGLYQFTNGLWWAGDTLWTTNTNGFELIALSPGSMAPLQTLRILGTGQGRYLGMAVASHGRPRATSSELRPLATVVRFVNGMVVGRIVDVFPDGSEREFAGSAGMEPRDIAWQGERLLAVDGASFSVRQFDADGHALPDFGGPDLRAALASLMRDKQRWGLWYRAALFAAIALFLVGFVVALRVQRQEQAARQARVITPLALGIPVLSRARRWQKALLFLPVWLLLIGWFCLAVWPIGLPGGWLRRLLPVGPGGAVIGLLLTLAAVTLILLYLRLALAWAAARPDWEPVINAWALQSLSRPELAQVLEPNETVRETLLLAGLPARWVVLTQRRILVFSVNLRDRTLRQSIAITDVGQARLRRWARLSWRSRLRSLWNGGLAKLELGGSSRMLLSGDVVSVRTAERVVALLSLQRARVPRPVRASAPLPSAGGRWRWQVLASAMVPGLGQWMQRRAGTGLIFFLAFAVLMLAGTVPLAWTLAGPRAAVSAGTVATTLAGQLLVSALAMWDCWNMRQR